MPDSREGTLEMLEDYLVHLADLEDSLSAAVQGARMRLREVQEGEVSGEKLMRLARALGGVEALVRHGQCVVGRAGDALEELWESEGLG